MRMPDRRAASNVHSALLLCSGRDCESEPGSRDACVEPGLTPRCCSRTCRRCRRTRRLAVLVREPRPAAGHDREGAIMYGAVMNVNALLVCHLYAKALGAIGAACDSMAVQVENDVIF